jgi:uncharacterized protein YdiU (UPF0061 family)
MTRAAVKPLDKKSVENTEYSQFDQISGQHPLKGQIPSFCVLYRARPRPHGKIAYFNFNLAKEMGLITNEHEHKLTKALIKKILETFSLTIINEYDIAQKKKFKNIKPNTFMATRYLQLQHPIKNGSTSGDGRSIWNGTFSNGKKVWDISSCGTGATCLSPATAMSGKFFESGDPSISYGCGTADLEDGISAVIMSEVFHAAGYPTERCLAVIQYPNGESINVRVSCNLIRPAHFFRYLKQKNWKDLKTLTDHFISRQRKNKEWEFSEEDSNPYDFFLEKMIDAFSRSAALFESFYIFCWLDWDGDNILASNAGILDYGSIRQFGLFHKDYRYDDTDRWSTNITEQKKKARFIVQSFHQLVDFIKNGKKQKISKFSKSYATKRFDSMFEYYRKHFLLEQIGIKSSHIPELLSKHLNLISRFEKSFRFFERVQSKKGIYKVSDGVTSNAVFCMRDFLREYPQSLLRDFKPWEWSDFVKSTRSRYALKKDLKSSSTRENECLNLQKNYIEILSVLSQLRNKSLEHILLDINSRSSTINRYDRITGNSSLLITDKILKKNKSAKKIFKAVEEFFGLHLNTKAFKKLPKNLHKIQKILNANNHDI